MLLYRIVLNFCLVKISCTSTISVLKSGEGTDDKDIHQFRGSVKEEVQSKVIYTRDIGERMYTINKRHQVNWPDAFEACKQFGASLVHFDNKEELSNIRQLTRDPELEDVDEFWSAAVFDKNSGKPGFVNIDQSHELDFFRFLRGDSRCVSIATKKAADNSTLIDLNYSFCMHRKAFMCQGDRILISDTNTNQINESSSPTVTKYYEKEINGWTYSMNMTEYVTWMEAFESCKRRGANLVTAAKFDIKSAWTLSKDPDLKKKRFWSAGVLDPKGETIWLGKATNLIEDPSLLHALQENKSNCMYHLTVADLSLAFLGPEDSVNLPLNYTLCSVKMLFMCEEPTYQILRTDSSEEQLPVERS